MKSKNDLAITFLGNLQQVWYANEIADKEDISGLLQRFKSFAGFLHHSLPLLYVLDYTQQQYLVMTNEMLQIAGYHPREFIESHLEKLMDVYHKDDFDIYNKKIFSRNADVLKQTPQAEHHQFVFSYNFRFFREDKKIA